MDRIRSKARIVSFIASAAFLAGAVSAETTNGDHNPPLEQRLSMEKPKAPLTTLDSLLDEAAKNNPSILAAQEKAAAAGKRPSQEGALPDPLIGFMSTNMGNPIPFTKIGEDPLANAGLSVSQEIPFPGKRSVKEEMSFQEAQGQLQELSATKLSVFSAVKAVYYELAFLEKAFQILSQNEHALQKLAQVAQAQYDVAKATQQDVLKAQVEASIIQSRVLDIEQKKETALAELNALLNRTPGTPLQGLEPLTPPATPPAFDTILALAEEQSPMLLAKKAEVEKSVLRVRSKRLDHYPDLTLGAYYGYSGDLPEMWQFRADFKVPLYFWEKQSNALQESEHTLSQTRREREALLQRLRAELKSAFAQAKTSEKLVELYRKRIVPDAALTVESSLQGYQTARVDFLTVLTNLVSQRDYQISYFEEVSKLGKALARIEELTGAKIS